MRLRAHAWRPSNRQFFSQHHHRHHVPHGHSPRPRVCVYDPASVHKAPGKPSNLHRLSQKQLPSKPLLLSTLALPGVTTLSPTAALAGSSTLWVQTTLLPTDPAQTRGWRWPWPPRGTGRSSSHGQQAGRRLESEAHEPHQALAMRRLQGSLPRRPLPGPSASPHQPASARAQRLHPTSVG